MFIEILLCVQTVLGPEATTANKTDHIPGPMELMFRPQMSEQSKDDFCIRFRMPRSAAKKKKKEAIPKALKKKCEESRT